MFIDMFLVAVGGVTVKGGPACRVQAQEHRGQRSFDTVATR